VHHTGGPHYTTPTEEKIAYWKDYERGRARKARVKRMLYRIPLFPRLNGRFAWFERPQ
jgi:hypothetical protein